MENEIKTNRLIGIFMWLLFIFSGALVLAFSFLSGKSYEAILRNTIVTMILTGTVVFMQQDAAGKGESSFFFDNFSHRYRFIVLYLAGIVLACVFSLIPNHFWPYMALFLMLGLFSNIETGLVSGIGFVAISVMLEENGNLSEFLMYVIAGAVILALFRNISENTAILAPVIIAMMVQAVLIMAFNVLFLNRTLSFKLLLIPILNLMLNLIIIMIFLNIYGVYVIRKSNDMYMEINDAEFPLLVQLKEKNKDEYYKAIHTAYLAERVAQGLSLNARAIKTVSYYHRIGVLEDKKSWQDISHFYLDNKFPEEAIEYLHEYVEPPKNQELSKEAFAVNICETVVTSISYLINKDKDVKIDYDNLIDKIMNKKIEDGSLKNYDITFREYDQIRKILKKEKLYYDFLR
jgi:membrane-associated HD superfamily phosphohydrolase